MPLTLTREQEEQERIEQILKDHDQLVQLYGRDVLKQRLQKLRINKMTFDTLFSDGCVLVDINDWTNAFGGDKQAVANALRKAASKTITEQEFERYLNSVPASVRPQLRNLRDSAHDNTITIEKEWDVRNEAEQLVPVKEKIQKSAIENLIGGTEGEVTAEKIQDVQELVSNYLTVTADKVAGPAVTPQPEAVQVADDNMEVEEPSYESPAPVPTAHEHTDVEEDEDQEFLQDLEQNNSFVHDVVISFMWIQFNSGHTVRLDVCLGITLMIYDAQERQALLLVQQISASLSQSNNKASTNPYGFFAASQPQQSFFGVRCRDEAEPMQPSRVLGLIHSL